MRGTVTARRDVTSTSAGFLSPMREHFTTGSVPFRKAYMRSLIDVIEVDDSQIRIKGSKDVLERAVMASRNREAGGSQMSTKWRAGQNKTANTYVIEIAFDSETKPVSQSAFVKSTTRKPRYYRK